MDIDKIILNKGYNPDNKEKIKAFFPTIVDKTGITRKDEFDEEFAKWIKAFYPLMVKYLGKDETETVLTLFTYELNIDPIANAKNSSGVCLRNEKRIQSNWAVANIHNAAIALLHEAGHVGDVLWGEEDLLIAGCEDREDIFTKLDEANVSVGQNIVECGKFSKKYMMFYDDQLKFKSRSAKYCHYEPYLECIKLLLGKNASLIDKNAKASTIVEKNMLYQQIKMNLKNNLEEEQFARLIDSLNGLILHMSYPLIPGDLKRKYQELVVKMRRRSPEEFEKMYEKNVSLARSRGTYGRTIDEDIDDLCALTLEVLKQRLESPQYDKFTALKQIATYITMVGNSSEQLTVQTEELLELWKKEISKIDIQKASITKNNILSEENRLALLCYLFSIEGIELDDLVDTKIIEIPSETTNEMVRDNAIYINVGKKGLFKFYKTPPIENNWFIIQEAEEDKFFKGIEFKEVEFIKEFPSGEIRGELVDTLENRRKLKQAVKDGSKLLTGEFFEQFKTTKQRSHEDD